MYESTREKEDIFSTPMQIKAADFSAPAKKKKHNPYEGTPLKVSGKLANHIKASFGISAGELALRQSPEVAEMGARATAQGNAIRFAPGEFRPDTREGMEVLGHELAHVREQASGNVHAPGGSVFQDAGHEVRSDAAGEAFASGGLSGAAPISLGGLSAESAPVQGSLRKGVKNKFYNLIGSTGRGKRWLEEKAKDSVNRKKDEKLSQIRNGSLDQTHRVSEDDDGLIARLVHWGNVIGDNSAHIDSYKLLREEFSRDQRDIGQSASYMARDWKRADVMAPRNIEQASAYGAVERKSGNAYQRAKSAYAAREENENLIAARDGMDQFRESYNGEFHTTRAHDNHVETQALRNLFAYRKALEAGENPGVEMLYRAHDDDTPLPLPEEPDFFFSSDGRLPGPEEMESLRQRRRQQLEQWRYNHDANPAPDIDEEISSENKSISPEDANRQEMTEDIDRQAEDARVSEAAMRMMRSHAETEPAPQRRHVFEQEMPGPQYASHSSPSPDSLPVPQAQTDNDMAQAVAQSIRFTSLDTRDEYMPEPRHSQYSSEPSFSERLEMIDRQRGPVGMEERMGQIDAMLGPEQRRKWWQFWK